MFGANFFSDIDFPRSMHTSQFFNQDEDIEVAGIILRLNDASVIIYDVKQFDLVTGKISDYGFAMQPLIHNLKGHHYLIGGRYQMPVYRGSLPKELLKSLETKGGKAVQKPRLVFKKLVESGQVEQIETMQLVA